MGSNIQFEWQRQNGREEQHQNGNDDLVGYFEFPGVDGRRRESQNTKRRAGHPQYVRNVHFHLKILTALGLALGLTVLNGAQGALDAHFIGMNPKCRGDAGAQNIGLKKQGYERIDFLDAGVARQIPERVFAALARAKLQGHQAEGSVQNLSHFYFGPVSDDQ
ncbi:MAG: hypothetical protein ACE5EM_04360, partial [Sphingomonadales bacterium]